MSTSTIPASITRLYQQTGPFVTAYLDATRTSESGSHELGLRWQELRAQLKASGAAEDDLAALDETAMDGDRAPGRHGRVLVAAHGKVCFDEVLPNPPRRAQASLAPLPDLVPFLAQRDPGIAYVLVTADHAGADVVAVPAELAARGEHPGGQRIDGKRQYPIHKTSRDEWDERHFQNRVDNSWATNARDVAEAVQRQALAIQADVVLVAGGQRARSMVAEDVQALLGPRAEVVELEQGGGDDEHLAGAVRDALLRRMWHERRTVLDHLRQNLGRNRFAVAGLTRVLEAVRRGQVDTVVLSDDPSSPLTAWIGPEPLQLGTTREDLTSMGVAEPQEDRLDSALLRALAGSDGQLLITPNAHEYLEDGIGALLRYDDAATH